MSLIDGIRSRLSEKWDEAEETARGAIARTKGALTTTPPVSPAAEAHASTAAADAARNAKAQHEKSPALFVGFGASAGIGFEVGIVGDARDMFGDGHQVSVSAGPVAVSASFSDDERWTGLSVSTGKSVGAGAFRFDTHTEDRHGR